MRRFKIIKAVYFSPTGATEMTAKLLAERLSAELEVPYETASYTLPDERRQGFSFGRDELVVWATPVYAGRIPNKTLEYVKGAIKGDGAHIIAVAVYGNRSFGDALCEMCGIIKDGGCLPLAGIAAVARHAFSDTLALGRPDEADMSRLTLFARKIAQKLKSGDDIAPAAVPGCERLEKYYTPLREDGAPAKFLKAAPKVRAEKCTRCGLCESVCPMGVVTLDDHPKVVGACIKCMACVKKCPEGALYFDDGDFLSHIRMIEKSFAERKEPELFL
ncbi:MAG: EFR1 family ferrodoxin [Clostridia bacterium]|nr:EFR1 family ferrodoxin [Clostridia bacterium]